MLKLTRLTSNEVRSFKYFSLSFHSNLLWLCTFWYLRVFIYSLIRVHLSLFFHSWLIYCMNVLLLLHINNVYICICVRVYKIYTKYFIYLKNKIIPESKNSGNFLEFLLCFENFNWKWRNFYLIGENDEFPIKLRLCVSVSHIVWKEIWSFHLWNWLTLMFFKFFKRHIRQPSKVSSRNRK